jgi:hypothetical protein
MINHLILFPKPDFLLGILSLFNLKLMLSCLVRKKGFLFASPMRAIFSSTFILGALRGNSAKESAQIFQADIRNGIPENGAFFL